MEKEPGPDVIKATQTSLGKYVKRPPLSDKLLKKPPFRFLHDIVTTVLKTTQFFEGLFEEDELISENVKDRDSKILFLNKVISVLALTTGKNISAKPSKIVAGQEAEKTNELLQCLAYALDNKLSSTESVAKYKDNSKTAGLPAAEVKTKEKLPKTTKTTNDTKKLTSRSSEKLTTKKEPAVTNKNDKTKANEIKSKRKDEKSKNEPAKKPQNLKAVGKKSSLESNSSQVSVNNTPPKHENREKDVSISGSNNISEQNVEIKPEKEIIAIKKPPDEADSNNITSFKDKDVQEKLNNSNTENELNSSLSSQDLMDVENETVRDKVENKNENSEPKFQHPTYKEHTEDTKPKVEAEEPRIAKKPRPVLIPKHDSSESEGGREAERSLQDNVVNTSKSEMIRPASVRPSSSRPGAPRLKEKIDNILPENDNLLLGKVNIITENAQNDEEEDTSVIIVDQNVISENGSGDQPDALQMSSNEHGHLVQQILNSQKELSQGTGKTEIEWQYGAQKAKEASSQEIEQLRFNIQALSRVANPLGKLLDHIQEDVEVMRQELQQWTKVYEEVSRDMVKEKAATEETLVPLQTRVKQLDVDIVEKRDKINDIKILIHKNTTRIEKLLANGNVQ